MKFSKTTSKNLKILANRRKNHKDELKEILKLKHITESRQEEKDLS